MGFWGWRRLLAVFVSVWVVGCSPTHDAAPTLLPTLPPRLTLTARVPILHTPSAPILLPTLTPVYSTPTSFVYTVEPGDTLLGLSQRFGVPLEALQAANGDLDPLALPVGETLMIPNPRFAPSGVPILPTSTPLSLDVESPTCYDTPTDSILCLGTIRNTQPVPVERVTISTRLVRADGGTLAEGSTGLEQTVIPAGSAAPYRLLFRADWREYAASLAWLSSADAAPLARYTTLTVETEQSLWNGGTFTLLTTLRNPEPQSVQVLRAVVTLTDSKGHVVGYRVVQLDTPLLPDARLALRVDVTPYTTDRDLSHTLYVEALRLEE